MASLAVGGIVYVVIMPFLSGERKADKRLRAVTSTSGRRGARTAENEVAQSRRRQVQETLDELEAKNKAKKTQTLRARLLQAGLDIQTKIFYIASAVFAFCVGIITLLTVSPSYVAAFAAFAAGVGFPRWVLSFLGKRRQKKFLEEFANAIDIIVRGVKSGLPLNDCLQIIANESPEPIKNEFVELCEQQRIGIPLAQAFDRMYDRMPLPEVNFFAIVIAIQQQAGGNLAEALDNLSRVLRDRKRLRAKVQAFSAEAKSSAAIIGSLPIIVMLIVYVTTPSYIALLWEEDIGNVMLIGSAFWMTCGILVMRKMINFDY